MSWFKRGLPPHQTALAMIGARAGDRVLFTGAHAAVLAAEVALVTGLNGQTLLVDPADSGRERVTRAAADAGALVDFLHAPSATLPVDDNSFDIVVVNLSADGAAFDRAMADEACRIVRPGGRIVVRHPSKRRRFLGDRGTPLPPVVDVLSRAGAVAARHLASADGIAYFEARKSRP